MVAMNESIQLKAEARAEKGSNKVRRMRKDGWLPGIVYNSDGQSVPIKMERHAFEMVLRRIGRHNVIMELEIAGQPKKKVLLKEFQRDSIRDHLTHADFMEISMTKKLRVPVEIKLAGDPAGVTQQGGILEHLLRSIDVECLPADMIQEVEVDVSGMMLGQSMFVRDIKLDPKLTLLTSGDIAIALVQMPRMEEEKAPEEAAAAEGAEEGPEVVGEKGKEAAAEGAEGAAKGAAAKGVAAKGAPPAAGEKKEEPPEKPKKGGKK